MQQRDKRHHCLHRPEAMSWWHRSHHSQPRWLKRGLPCQSQRERRRAKEHQKEPEEDSAQRPDDCIIFFYLSSQIIPKYYVDILLLLQDLKVYLLSYVIGQEAPVERSAWWLLLLKQGHIRPGRRWTQSPARGSKVLPKSQPGDLSGPAPAYFYFYTDPYI